MPKYNRQKPTKQNKANNKDSKPKKPIKSKKPRLKADYLFTPPEAVGLTPRQRRFCEEYIVDLNGYQAAKRAGYSKLSCMASASQQLSNPKVIKYVNYLKIQRARRLEVTQDRIVQELARIAYHDQRTFYQNDNEAVPLQQITDDQQTAIKNIHFRNQTVEEPVEDIDGNIKMEKVTHRIVSYYTLHDRTDALRMLGHHLGMSLDKPSDHVPQKPDQEAIGFETLVRKLEASQLEKLTQMLLVAQSAIVKQDFPANQAKMDKEEDIPSDHWSRKAETETMQ